MAAGLVGRRLEDFDALGDELLVAADDLVGRDEEGELDTGEFASGALVQRELDCTGLEGESGGGFGGDGEVDEVAVEGFHAVEVFAEHDRVVELAHGAEHGRSPIGVDGYVVQGPYVLSIGGVDHEKAPHHIPQ